MQQVKAMQPPSKASPQQQIISLVKQAEFYTTFLLNHLEGSQAQENTLGNEQSI